jgi:hypothetical protein
VFGIAGGGWGEHQHVRKGQGLKDPFFGTSFRITKAMSGSQRVFHKKQTEVEKNLLTTANFLI